MSSTHHTVFGLENSLGVAGLRCEQRPVPPLVVEMDKTLWR